MNSLKEAFSKQNLLKNLNFFGELNLGLILTQHSDIQTQCLQFF